MDVIWIFIVQSGPFIKCPFKRELKVFKGFVYYIDIKPYHNKIGQIILKAKIGYGINSETNKDASSLILRQDCLSTYASKYSFGSMGSCDGTPTGYTIGTSFSPWDGGEVIERIITNKLRLQDNYDCIYSSPLPSYEAGFEYYNLSTNYYSYPLSTWGGGGTFVNSCMARTDYITQSNNLTTFVNDKVDNDWATGYEAADIDMITNISFSGGDNYYHFSSYITAGLIGEF